MTEAEWLACADPMPMLEFSRDKASDRKLQLFTVACSGLDRRNSLGRLPKLKVAEGFADDLATLAELREHWLPPGSINKFAWPERPFEWAATFVRFCHDEARTSPLGAVYPRPNVLPPILRDIFGNPFRPSPPLPHAVLCWNDGTVRRMAEAIYDDRKMPKRTLDNSRLAILADALLDAGCEDEDLIQHCRSDGPHVRGCWAVDAILGKS